MGNPRSSKAIPVRVLLAALLLCACAPSHAGWFSSDKQPVPQWGMDAYKTHTPDYAKDAAAVILFDEYVETVDDQGRAVERERIVKRILKPQGRRDAACGVSYDVDEKINYFHAWTIAADESSIRPRTPISSIGATPAFRSCFPPARSASSIPRLPMWVRS
jgi:hypothetical protein